MTVHQVSTAAQLTAALGNAAAGDEIILAPGNYGAYQINRQYAGEVIVRGDPANRPVFAPLTVSFCQHVTVRGLRSEALGGQHYNIEAFDVRNVKVDDVEIVGGQVGIAFFGLTAGQYTVLDWELTNCTFAGIANDAIKASRTDGALIENNWGVGHLSAGASHGDWLQFEGDSRNVTIRGNVLLAGLNTGNQDFQGLWISNGVYSDFLIENNLIYVGQANGIACGGANVEIRYNTVMHVNDGTSDSVTWIVGGGANIHHNIVGARVQDGAGPYGDNNLRLVHNDPDSPWFYDAHYSNAMAGLGAQVADFEPVSIEAQTLGAFARINELLGQTQEPPPMDYLTITAVTINDPAMGSVAIVGTPGQPDHGIDVTIDPAWSGAFVTGTYTAEDQAGQSATAAWSVPVANPAPVLQDDVHPTPVDPGATAFVNVLGNDTA